MGLSSMNGEGAFESMGVIHGWDFRTKFPLTVRGGNAEQSASGFGVASAGGVASDVVEDNESTPLILSTRFGSPQQRSYSDKYLSSSLANATKSDASSCLGTPHKKPSVVEARR